MRMHGFRPIYWIFALLICLLFPVLGNCQEYQVKLNDGRILKVKHYYEKDGTIFLFRYGNYIGIDKSEVVEIIKTQDAESPSNSPKTAGSGESKEAQQIVNEKDASADTEAARFQQNDELEKTPQAPKDSGASSGAESGSAPPEKHVPGRRRYGSQ